MTLISPATLMPNLVQTYIDACGGSPSEALHRLNDDLGTQYRISRLYEWRAGSRTIPDHVAECMRRYVLPHAWWLRVRLPESAT
jgi:hypothetical protein